MTDGLCRECRRRKAEDEKKNQQPAIVAAGGWTAPAYGVEPPRCTPIKPVPFRTYWRWNKRHPRRMWATVLDWAENQRDVAEGRLVHGYHGRLADSFPEFTVKRGGIDFSG